MQISTMTTVPLQFPESSYRFELDIMIIDDDIVEMTERFIVSVELRTPVRISDASNLNATVFILDDEGT